MTSRLHRAIRGVPSNRAKNDTRVGPRRSHAKRRAVTLIGLSVGGVLLLAGCTTAVALDTSPPIAASFGHVHGIVGLADDAVLLGTHSGLYKVTKMGIVMGPIGGNDFDAMGLTGTQDTLFASGHPGPKTAALLGTPNLGVIESVDSGVTWKPVAFTGTDDFHVLTAASDGTIYAISSTSPAMRISHDKGATWSNGATIPAADVAIAADNTLYAATPEGLLQSEDSGATFTTVPGAPLLYQVQADSSGALVGVSTDGILWRLASGSWTRFGTATGTVQALGAVGDGTIVLVDDRGVVQIRDDKPTVLKLSHPKS
ncbi:F510_1955 family glycosylhydrolase [Microbacterium xylanilyticum]